MKKILQKENKVLRRKSSRVKPSEITSEEVQNIVNSMMSALESQVDGVALAAPQIGENRRIFIVSWKVFAKPEEVEDINEEKMKQLIEKYGYKVFINPKITNSSKNKVPMEEGCLSVRPYFGIVDRHQKCKISAYDENGQKIERGASGLLSQIFQHEIDHLNGILFTDKARDLKRLDTYMEKDDKE